MREAQTRRELQDMGGPRGESRAKAQAREDRVRREVQEPPGAEMLPHRERTDARIQRELSAMTIANRREGRMPRTMARLRTDGGTSFVIRSKSATWHSDFRHTFDWAFERWHMREKGKPEVMLPLPRLGRAPCLAFEGANENKAAERLDPRFLGWGHEVAPPKVTVTVRGRDTIEFFCADRAHVTFSRKTDDKGESEWECRIQVKAREVYADGLGLWMRRWLGLWGWILKGKWCRTDELHDQGWNCSYWHLNSDFADLHVEALDLWFFQGWRGGSQNAKDRRLDQDSKLKKAHPYFTESLYLGQGNSDATILIYRKSEQLRSAKEVEPAHSLYAPLWRENDWDGEENITRVELRLRKKGLQYVDPRTRELVYDFRDPAMLLNEEAVRNVWQFVTTKRRLTCPRSPSERKRITRAYTDPAWLEVISLGLEPNFVPDLRQLPRRVREMTRQERLAKDQLKAMLLAFDFAARHGATLGSYEDVGDVLIAMGKRFKEGEPEEFQALPRFNEEMQQAKGKKPPPFEKQGRYAAETSVFFKGEADALYEDFIEEVGAELQPIDWSRVDDPTEFESEKTDVEGRPVAGLRNWSETPNPKRASATPADTETTEPPCPFGTHP